MKKQFIVTAATVVALVLGGAGVAAATSYDLEECVPFPGQEEIPPTYAVEYEYTRKVIDQEAQPEIPGKPATYATEYLWKKVGVLTGVVYKTVWLEDGESPGSAPWGYKWIKTDTTRPGRELTPAVPAVPAVPELSHDEFTWSEETSLDGWTATGKTRSGEGLTRLIDPGQPYLPPVPCEEQGGNEEPGEEPGGNDEQPVEQPVEDTDGQAPAPAPAAPAQPQVTQPAFTG